MNNIQPILLHDHSHIAARKARQSRLVRVGCSRVCDDPPCGQGSGAPPLRSLVARAYQAAYLLLTRALELDATDSLLSEHRDMAAAKRFFARSIEVVGHSPEKVTTDGHDAYPRAIRETLGEDVVHRCSRYMNNRIEQDHRGIKGRYHPMRGFGTFDSAARFCSAHDELRDYFRHRTRMDEVVPLGVQREQFRTRSAELRAMLNVA